ncbi:hypothetical protein SNEBB_010615 [Seison nebaliae]|nr:hypothetical protein SNEBB_010615 [Seison nebaliae]
MTISNSDFLFMYHLIRNHGLYRKVLCLHDTYQFPIARIESVSVHDVGELMDTRKMVGLLVCLGPDNYGIMYKLANNPTIYYFQPGKNNNLRKLNSWVSYVLDLLYRRGKFTIKLVTKWDCDFYYQGITNLHQNMLVYSHTVLYGEDEIRDKELVIYERI